MRTTLSRICRLAFYSVFIVLGAQGIAYGDGENQHERSPSDVGADASIADDRLPPVFPGEEVHDGNKKIKVWSTSGGVPVSQPPEPWRNPNDKEINLRNGVGVLIDARPTGVR